ncbi:MAG: hypothetical protein WC348_01565 [Patescibacteria group bacterium]|jgi:hypothetical protein
MFSSGGEKPNIKLPSQSGTNLTLLVFALGILSLASIGVMTLSVVKQLRPTAFTAINKQLNYQGKLQNAGGITLADGNYSMKFSIYDDPTVGSRLWTECGTVGTPTARTVAVANGVFSVMLGDTNSNSCPGGTDSNAITLDFNSDSYYLGFTVESDSEMLPRKRLGASGYAFNADLLDGFNTSAAGGSVAFVPVTDASGHLTLTQNLILGGVLKNADGTVGAPSYTFTSDLDTGLYYSATQINIGVGGSTVANVSASGLAVDTVKTLTATTLTLKGTVADGGTAVGATIGSNSTLSTTGAKLASFVNNTTEKAYIDKDGYWNAPNGAAGTPSITFANDKDNGFFYSSANNWRAVANGTAILEFDASGIYVGGSGNIGSGNNITLTLKSFQVDGAANVAVAQDTYYAFVTAGAKLFSWKNHQVEKAYVDYLGSFNAGAGTNLLPAYSFVGDPNTGIYNPSADRVDLVAGGTVQLAITSGTIYFDNMRALNLVSLGLRGAIADGASAIGTKMGNAIALTTAGAKIVSFYNDAWVTEKAYIDKDGNFYGPGANFSGLSVSSAVYTDASKNLTSTAPATGTIGYWSRATTTLSPATANDIVAVTGNSGDLLTLTSTATGASNKALSIAASGATVGTDYGAYISNTGAATTNVGLYTTASGATNNYAAIFDAGYVGIGNTTPTASLTLTQAAGTTGTPSAFIITGGAHTGITAATEDIGVNLNFSANKTWAAGAGPLATQREVVVQAPTYIGDVGGALTMTDAATFYISGAPTAGANMTISNPWALWIDAGNVRLDGNLKVDSLSASSAVYTDASKNLTSTPPATGAIGYWSRTGTTLSPATANDVVNVDSNTVGAAISSTATNSGAVANSGGNFLAAGTSGAMGVYGGASGAGTVYGVYGQASNPGAVTNYGVYGTAAGDTGVGVFGSATDTGAAINYGGYFTAAGTGGAVGIYSEATGTGGAAVSGLASATTSALNFGGYFEARGDHSWSFGVKGYLPNSVDGKAVVGHAAETTSTNYGGWFQSDGATGIGVYGKSTYTSTATVNYGGWFRADGLAGRGVYGETTTVGATITHGGDFWAASTGTSTSGARGVATGAGTVYGVEGLAQSTGAVTNFGGYFTASGETGRGVYGMADNTAVAATNYGGHFTAAGAGANTTGVYGEGSSSGAVTNYGGRFIAAGETGIGAYGNATSTGATVNYGGKFYAGGSGGAYGVYGEANNVSGTNYGVYGKVTSGYAVYGDHGTVFGYLADKNYGVYGQYSATQFGYIGDSTYGVYARGTIGVYGTDGTRYGQLGTGSNGVYGYYDATHYGYIGGATNGVYGTGGTGEGVRGEATTGYGVIGLASDTGAVTNYGGYFSAAGDTGQGVYGTAPDAGAVINYGGYFSSAGTGTGATGVLGTTAAAGTVYGVQGKATNTGAVTNYGGYFLAYGDTGQGIYAGGMDTGAVTNYGGYFEAAGTTGRAVFGAALATGASTAYGGYFTSASDTGRGVYGAATDTGAVVNYGGYFSSAGTGTGAAGVYGTSAATGTVYGVQGYASNTGAYENYGGYFVANGTTSRGVYGQANTSGATVSYGGYFSSSSTGAGTAGVYGIGAGAGTVYGVTGLASNTGAVTNYGGVFSAAGTTGRAVYGEASSSGATANYGGYFTAAGTGGARGVFGTASGASGTNYGIYGSVTSATGYAGYFTGGYGVYASLAHIAGTGAGGEELDVEGQIQFDLDGTTDTLIGVCKSVADGAGVEADVEFRDCTSTPSDIAEWYDTTGTEAGDVVAATDDTVTFQGEMYDPLTGLPLGTQETITATILTPSSEPYQKTLLGVVSTNPYESFGKGVIDVSHLPNPIAVVGRVPTKVSTENGVIRPGDPITSSSVTGVGMKATKPGMIIGYAVDHYSGAGIGTAFVNINPGWHSGFAINTDGVISLFDDDFTFNTSGIADGIIQGYNSKGLAFRGSGWDGAAAQNIEMKIGNVVTDASNYKLSVLNNAGTEVAYLDQAGALGLSGKFYPASPTGAQTDAYIFYRNNRIRTNASGWATGSFDFAEMFLSRELLEAGDVVILDETTNEYVKKSTAAYDKMALGIVSTEPGFLAGTNVNFDDPSADQGYPIALAGRVPTKVSAENGPIRPGDFLTTSTTSGAAMKATESGIIIGTALESFDGPGVGLIKVFVNLAWYNVTGDVTPVSEMSQLTLSGDLNMNGNYILNVGKIVGQDEKWSIDENGILKIKLIAEDATEKEMFGLSSAKVELTLSGTDRLENGTKMIDLSLIDPEFVKNISAETPLKVVVTLNEQAYGVYVAEKTAYSFRVAELNAGTSDAAFDWIVIARRKGYDDPPPTEVAPPTEPAPAPSEPAPVESTPSEPAPSEPAPSEPAPSEPIPTEPAPAPTEPVPTEPAPAEPTPAPTEPAPSEPAPAPTEPAPSEPAPAI